MKGWVYDRFSVQAEHRNLAVQIFRGEKRKCDVFIQYVLESRVQVIITNKFNQ